jgi:DNA-binding SARP family transcriptional activator
VLEVRLFGTAEVRSNGDPVVLASGRALTLLAYLVLRRGVAQRREHLAFLLWPDSTEKQARTNLRHVVHTLRTTLPGADRFLLSTQHTLGWDGGWADVVAFDEELAAADGADGDEAVERLRARAVLYDRIGGGEFLHFFTRAINGVFFEVLERRGGYDRYGEANAPVRLAAQAALERSPAEELTALRG